MKSQFNPSRLILPVLAAFVMCANAAAATPSADAERSDTQFSETMDLYSLAGIGADGRAAPGLQCRVSSAGSLQYP